MSVSIYSVDSLRQLVGKLLARAKLTPDSFSDHEDALKPFISIMKQCGNSTIRELTVQCISQTVLVHSGLLASGWKSVLHVLRLAAADRARAVSAPALLLLEQALAQMLASGDADTVADFVACVGLFTTNADFDLALSATNLLLSTGETVAASGRGAAEKQRLTCAVLQQFVRPLSMEAETSMSLQQHALEVMFQLLERTIDDLDAAALLAVVDGSVKPVFAAAPGVDAELMAVRCKQYLPHFYQALEATVGRTPVFFDALVDVARDSFRVGPGGGAELAHLALSMVFGIAVVLKKAPAEDHPDKWDVVFGLCGRMWAQVEARLEEIRVEGDPEAPALGRVFPLVEAFPERLASIYAETYLTVPAPGLQLLDVLQRVITFCRQYTVDGRRPLHAGGLSATARYLRCLKGALADGGDASPVTGDLEARALDLARELMAAAATMRPDDPSIPLVIESIRVCGQLSAATFGKEVGALFPALSGLVAHDHAGIRGAVSDLLTERVSGLLAADEAKPFKLSASAPAFVPGA